MKVLISGAGGALGQEILRQLDGCSGYDIHALSSRPEKLIYNGKNIHAVHNHEMERIVEENEFDILLHLAFPRNTDGYQYAQGIQFTYRLYDTLKMQRKISVIHISSQSIYGLNRREAATESTPIELTSVYTTGKFCIEQTTNLLFAEHRYTNIRLATLIGKKSTNKVPNIFLKKLMDGEDVTVRGEKQIFSFLDIRDAAEAIIRVMGSNIPWKEAYNLGTPESYDLLDLAYRIQAFVKNKNPNCGQVIHTPEDVYLNNTMDSSLFYKDFSWTPSYSLTDSLEYIWNE